MVSGQGAVDGRTGQCRFPGWLLFPVLVAVPLFAHGCHTGDHDDEPAVVPHRAGEAAEEPEAPR